MKSRKPGELTSYIKVRYEYKQNDFKIRKEIDRLFEVLNGLILGHKNVIIIIMLLLIRRKWLNGEYGYMKKIVILGIVCALMAMSGCRKKYVSPLEAPVMTKAPEDNAYDFDFDQMNNDVIETLQDEAIYTFVKDLSVSGDNDKKEIVLEADIIENVSDDAVELFMSDATKAIVSAASTQDFRIDKYTEDTFGNLFEIYSYKYKITCGEKIVREETINAGESVPFDPSMTKEQAVG